MATKQTEELGYYNGSLPFIEDKDTSMQASLLVWHEWENKRIEISKFVEFLSGSTGDKEIQNLTVGRFIPSELNGFIDVDGNFSFNSNNESGTLEFENGAFKVSNDLEVGADGSGSITAGLVSTNELSPRSLDSKGEFLTYMYGGFSFVSNHPNQKYLVVGDEPSVVFNGAGGLTKIYSQTEIDTKLQPLSTINAYFKGSLGDFNSTSDFRSALNNMIKDKKEAGRYVATLYGSLIIVTFALLDKSSGTYSQWVEGSIIKGSDGELYLNNELGYRICGRVGLGTTWGVWRANVLDDELPISATKSHDGLMSKEDKAAIESMKTTIESLEARIAALEAK